MCPFIPHRIRGRLVRLLVRWVSRGGPAAGLGFDSQPPLRLFPEVLRLLGGLAAYSPGVRGEPFCCPLLPIFPHLFPSLLYISPKLSILQVPSPLCSATPATTDFPHAPQCPLLRRTHITGDPWPRGRVKILLLPPTKCIGGYLLTSTMG